MAKLTFTGPEGKPFCGATLRVVTLEDVDIDILDALQRETGAGMDEVAEWFDPKARRAKAAVATFYFTLRTAGMFVSFKESWDLLRAGEYEQVEEPGDSKSEETPDPPQAPTGSSRGDVSGTGKSKTGGPRKHAKTSAPQSAPAS